MKLLHVADLHLEREWFDWTASVAPQFDLLVFAGDLLNTFSDVPLHAQAIKVSQWLTCLPTPSVICSGNHDYFVQYPDKLDGTAAEGGWVRSLRGVGKVAVVDSGFRKVGDLSLYCNGWMNLPARGLQADVLVTHAPPSGCPCASTGHQDFGDPCIWPAVQCHSPKLLLCGHVHQPRHFSCMWPGADPTTLVLVPGCNEDSEIPAHWVIDTIAKVALHSTGIEEIWK